MRLFCFVAIIEHLNHLNFEGVLNRTPDPGFRSIARALRPFVFRVFRVPITIQSSFFQGSKHNHLSALNVVIFTHLKQVYKFCFTIAYKRIHFLGDGLSSAGYLRFFSAVMKTLLTRSVLRVPWNWGLCKAAGHELTVTEADKIGYNPEPPPPFILYLYSS